MGNGEIEALVDPTFAVIAQHWNSFNATVQQRAYDMISTLLKTHAGMIREMVNTIPSLASIPLMAKFEQELGKIRAQMDPRHQFQAFSERCQNENATVVIRALAELEAYLQTHQSYLHDLAINEQPDPVVARLVRSLLDACVRFNELSESNSVIATLCAKCLGLIGCLDPTKIEAQRDIKEILVLFNFEKADETVDFIVFFIQEVLVKALLSATNTRAQGFLGYAIQKLLECCGFDPSLTIRARDSQSTANFQRWLAIPESTRNILTPFLTSKYVVRSVATAPRNLYPIYNVGVGHATWLRDFVFDLLWKGSGVNALMIFPICRRVVRGQDIAISNFLLPFVALNVILGPDVEQKDEIEKELLAVLSYSMPENNQSAKENLILCSQVSFIHRKARNQTLRQSRMCFKPSTTFHDGCKKRKKR